MALRPQNFGDLLTVTFSALRREAGTVFGITFAACAVLGVLAVLIAAAALGFDTTAGYEPGVGLTTGATAVWSVALASVTTPVAGILAYPVIQGIVGRRASMGETWRHTARAIPNLLALTVLSLIVVALLAGLPLLVMISALTSESIEGLLLSVLLGVVLLAFGLWLMTRLSPALPAVVIDGCGPASALQRSWQLTRGTAQWRVLGLLLLIGLISGIIAGVVSSFFQLGAEIFATAGSESSLIPVVLVISGDIVASLITIPVAAVAITVIYVDLRIRLEGFDQTLAFGAAEVAAGRHPDGWPAPAGPGLDR